MRYILWLPTLLLMLTNGSNAPLNQGQASSEPQQNLRVLFIGNSYTIFNDLPLITQQLASSAPASRKLDVRMVAMMGATLQEHWDDGFALRALEQGSWDYVVLQEQSMRPLTTPELMRRYARLFDAEIKKAGAQTIFLVTWAHQDQPQNQAAITDAYMKIASELGATVAPVGPAWQETLKQNPQLALYKGDADSHPSPAGSYLAACVLYATIYGRSPVGLATDFSYGNNERASWKEMNLSTAWEPLSLSEREASLLQHQAWQAAESFDRL